MSRSPLPIAVDAFGGDHAPTAVIAAAQLAVAQGIPVVLVGPADQLKARLSAYSARRIPIVDAPDVVTMEDSASAPLRRKPGASIRKVAELVAAGEAAAAVSCGHSGAAMACALYVLGPLPGVDRPPLVTVVPRTDGKKLVLLDLGANVDCRPSHLVQFAVLGEAYARVVLGLPTPRVGLLANGEEPGKGNQQVRAAFPEIGGVVQNFVGNVEPLGALRGDCDVLVCDGFVGNVMLKTVEGTVEVVGRILREELLRRPEARLGAWLLRGALSRFRKRTGHDAVGGAMLLGVNGVYVVGHGRSDARAIVSAIQTASTCVEAGLIPSLRQEIGQKLRSVPVAEPKRED